MFKDWMKEKAVVRMDHRMEHLQNYKDNVLKPKGGKDECEYKGIKQDIYSELRANRKIKDTIDKLTDKAKVIFTEWKSQKYQNDATNNSKYHILDGEVLKVEHDGKIHEFVAKLKNRTKKNDLDHSIETTSRDGLSKSSDDVKRQSLTLVYEEPDLCYKGMEILKCHDLQILYKGTKFNKYERAKIILNEKFVKSLFGRELSRKGNAKGYMKDINSLTIDAKNFKAVFHRKVRKLDDDGFNINKIGKYMTTEGDLLGK